jgi:hypothetical protein
MREGRRSKTDMIRGPMKRRAVPQVHKRDRRKTWCWRASTHQDIHKLDSAWPGITMFKLPNWRNQRGQYEYRVAKRERSRDRPNRAAAHRPADLAPSRSADLNYESMSCRSNTPSAASRTGAMPRKPFSPRTNNGYRSSNRFTSRARKRASMRASNDR